MNENKILVNTDHWLSLIANKHGFIVYGIYDNGLVLKAATGRRQIESEKDRLHDLSTDLGQLGIDYIVRKLSNRQIEIKINQ